MMWCLAEAEREEDRLLLIQVLVLNCNRIILRRPIVSLNPGLAWFCVLTVAASVVASICLKVVGLACGHTLCRQIARGSCPAIRE